MLCLLLGACAQPQPTARTLVLVTPSEPATLDPILSNDYGIYAGPIVFSYLLDVNQRGELVPDIATRVPTLRDGISKDGLTVTYRLRRGVRWQDGTPLTARDVLFTFTAIMNPKNNVPTRTGYDQVAALRAPDPFTVVVRLKRRYAPFVSTFFILYPILPEHVLAKVRDLNRSDFNGRPIGSGPYRVTQWVRGDRVLYEANPRYWRGRPRIARVALRFVGSTPTILTLLRTREADAWIGAASGAYPQFKSLPRSVVSLLWANGFVCLDLNLRDPILRDVRVRRALALALDRARIVRLASHGVYVVTDTDQSPLSWAFDARAPRVTHDPAAARRLLDEAGWRAGPGGIRAKNGVRLALQFAYMSGYSTAVTIASMVAQQARDAGIDITLKGYPQALYDAPAQDGGILAGGKYQIGFDAKGMLGTDPDDSFLWSCSQIPPKGVNYSLWCNAKVEAALRDAQATYDRGRRRADYAIVQRELAADVPVIFLYRGQQIDVLPADLTGVIRSPSTSDFWSIWNWRWRERPALAAWYNEFMSTEPQKPAGATDHRVNVAAIDWLLNPPPGSAAAQARKYGIDLSLLAYNLQLDPTQRVEGNLTFLAVADQLRRNLRP